jgi:hypothetical protein
LLFAENQNMQWFQTTMQKLTAIHNQEIERKSSINAPKPNYNLPPVPNLPKPPINLNLVTKSNNFSNNRFSLSTTGSLPPPPPGPPPPPPMSSLPPGPPPPPKQTMTNTHLPQQPVAEGRGALLTDIRNGTGLKKVPESEKKRPADITTIVPKSTTSGSTSSSVSNNTVDSATARPFVSIGNPLVDEIMKKRAQLTKTSSGEMPPKQTFEEKKPVIAPRSNVVLPNKPSLHTQSNVSQPSLPRQDSFSKRLVPPPPPRTVQPSLPPVKSDRIVFDTTRSIDFETLPKEWQELFESNGIDKNMLQNPKLARKLINAMKKYEKQKKRETTDAVTIKKQQNVRLSKDLLNNASDSDKEVLANRLKRASMKFV